MYHLKNLLIGILVAYAAFDLMLTALVNGHTSLLQKLVEGMGQQNIAIAAILSVGLGVLAWCYAKSRKDDKY